MVTLNAGVEDADMNSLASIILPDGLDVEVLARRAEILPNILKIPVAPGKRGQRRERREGEDRLIGSEVGGKLIGSGIRSRLYGIGNRRIEIRRGLYVAEPRIGKRKLQIVKWGVQIKKREAGRTFVCHLFVSKDCL